MADHEDLSARVRQALARKATFAEKRMFGGVAFMVRGNMCVGVHKSELIVRLDPEAVERALATPGVRVFDLSGRPMKGWLLVGPERLAGKSLDDWVSRSLEFNSTLPQKENSR